jgi:hypothetical protein
VIVADVRGNRRLPRPGEVTDVSQDDERGERAHARSWVRTFTPGSAFAR